MIANNKANKCVVGAIIEIVYVDKQCIFMRNTGCWGQEDQPLSEIHIVTTNKILEIIKMQCVFDVFLMITEDNINTR